MSTSSPACCNTRYAASRADSAPTKIKRPGTADTARGMTPKEQPPMQEQTTRRHTIRGLALGIVALAVFAPAAQAHHAWQPMPGQPSAQVAAETTDPLIAEYVAVAQEFWGAVATCPGQGDAPPIPFHFVLYSDPGDIATGRAAQCYGWLNGRDWWPHAPRSEGWCAAIAHEVGHGLHGPGHSTDPSNVMYSSTEGGRLWNWEGLVPGCARFNPPAAAPEPPPVLHPLPPACEGRSYTRYQMGVAARSVYRSPSKVTERERQALRRFRLCARKPSSRPAMRATVRREIARRSGSR